MRIETDKNEVNKSSAEIYAFASDFNNLQKLMPSQVTNWQSTADECSFTISGMANIGMKILEKVPTSLIKISSHGKVPFAFTLDIHLTEITPAQCSVQLIFESGMNPMVAMMVEKPLKNFFGYLAHKMASL